MLSLIRLSSLISIHTEYSLTIYSIVMPLKFHVFENIMENGAFAPKEQMLHFP